VGCAGKTVRSLQNACHTRVRSPYFLCDWLLLWGLKIYDKALYKYTFTLPYWVISCATVMCNITNTNRSKEQSEISYLCQTVEKCHILQCWKAHYFTYLLSVLLCFWSTVNEECIVTKLVLFYCQSFFQFSYLQDAEVDEVQISISLIKFFLSTDTSGVNIFTKICSVVFT